MGIKHAYQSPTPNDPTDEVSSNRWNEDHQIDGPVPFPHVAAPVAPPADHVSLFGRRIAGRVMPAFIGPSGLDSALQPLLARNKIAWANPNGNSTAISLLGMAISGTGTATAANVGTANIHEAMRRLEYAVTTAATSAVAAWRSTAAQFRRGSPTLPFGGFFFVCRFGRSRGAAANATLRGFTGFGSITSAPGDADPSTTQTNAIGVGCDAGDTNYQIIHRNGTAAATKIDTGIPKAVADTSEMYELAMFSPPNAAEVRVRFERLSDGTVFETTLTTNLPSDTTLLAPKGYYSVGGTSSVIGYALTSLYIETDY